MTIPAMKAKSVRLQLHDYLKNVVNRLLESTDQPQVENAYSFIEQYSTSQVDIVREFCLSLQVDLPLIINRIHSLTGFQLEQFPKLLDLRYERALKFLDFDNEEERREFYLDLTFHIIRDLDNYIEERDKPKEPIVGVVDLKRGGSTASFFFYPFFCE